MTTGLQRKGQLAKRTAGADHLRSCQLDIYNEVCEEPDNWRTGIRRLYPTGRHHGFLHAEIVNCSLDSDAMLKAPCVFEWPDGRQYIACQVTRADVIKVSPSEFEIVTRISARVLGIAKYGDRRIEPAEARRQLLP